MRALIERNIKRMPIETACLYFVLMLISILVFFLLGKNRGYVLYKDSVVYTADDTYVLYGHGIMPGYFFFVQTMRSFFGDAAYLKIIAIVQGIFAGISVSCFALYMKKEFDLHIGSTIIIYLLATIPYCYSLPEEIATHAIMTESVAFSFFYLYVISALRGLFKGSFFYTISSMVWAIMLLLIRKQHVLLMVVSLYIFIRNVVRRKKTDDTTIIYCNRNNCWHISAVCIIYFSVPGKTFYSF